MTLEQIQADHDAGRDRWPICSTTTWAAWKQLPEEQRNELELHFMTMGGFIQMGRRGPAGDSRETGVTRTNTNSSALPGTDPIALAARARAIQERDGCSNEEAVRSAYREANVPLQ